MSERLCLKWHDFQDNVIAVFQSLRKERDQGDVTLACEDGQQVAAHRVILAASSPFFHAILKKNKHPHPLVFMRGVKLEGLVNLLCSESGTQTFVESETIESEIEERCTGEKPFVCTQCSYSSTTADNLKTHLRIHSGEKPFSCTQCEFSCTRVSYLKKHMLEHSGEKPFRCDQWNYSCARATMPLLRQAI